MGIVVTYELVLGVRSLQAVREYKFTRQKKGHIL